MSLVCKNKEFASVVTELHRAYSQYCDEHSLNVFYKGLAGLDMAEVRLVCDKWVADNRRMPSPADIRALVNQRKQQRTGGASLADNPLRARPGVRTLPNEARDLIRATMAKLVQS